MVEAFWDSEAQVWVAQSDDVMGLVTEANTLDALIYKLKDIIPELLKANNLDIDNAEKVIAFELITHRQELIEVA
jgi:predicted RNase H-like HicB family nuclease